MVVPKKTTRDSTKATPKASTSTSSKKASSAMSKKQEEALKKKIEQLLKKSGMISSSKSKPSTSKPKSESVKKTSSSKSSAAFFKKQDQNTKSPAATTSKTKSNSNKTAKSTSAMAKKTTATTKSKPKKIEANSKTKSSCSNGVCSVQPKAKPSTTKAAVSKTKSSCSNGSCSTKPKPKKTVASSSKSKTSCSDGSCSMKSKPKPKVAPVKKSYTCTSAGCFLTDNVNGVKKTATKRKSTTSSTSTKSTVPTKKAKSAATKPKPKPKKSSQKTTCKTGLCPFETDSDSDDSDDFSDFGFASRNGKRGGGGGGSGRRQTYDSDSSGWETDSSYSDCSTGNCPIRKRKEFNSSDEDSNEKFVENNALVSYKNKNCDSHVDSDSEYDSYEESSSCSDDYEFEDNSDDDDDTSSLNSDENSESDDNQYDFKNDSDDQEYCLPDGIENDIYIPFGSAIKCSPTENEVSFDSDESTQIFEIHEKVQVEISPNDLDKNEESEGSCPELVPIDFNDENNAEFYHFSDSEGTSFSEEEEEESDSASSSTNHKPSMRPEIFEFNSKTAGNVETETNKLDSKLKEDKYKEPASPVSLLKHISNVSPSSYKVFAPKTVNTPQKKKQDSSPKNVLNLDRNESKSASSEFRSKFYNAINSCQVLLLLKDTIYIYGTLKAKILAGSAEIYGYVPDNFEVFEVFSPRGYCSLYLKAIKNKGNQDINIKNELKTFKDDFLRSDLEEIFENFDEKHDAIILLERNDRDQKIQMLRKYMKENMFPNMNSITLERSFYASEFILRCIINTSSKNELKVDPAWDTIKIDNNSKLMVIGGKSVGKSTLVRYLINRNMKKLKKILLIDLDIGQPEMFVPQTISATLIQTPILGPGYLLGCLPEKSFVFGDTNVVLSPTTYINNVKQLLKYCYEQNSLCNIPWLVNTMGYNKGFGSELISIITKYLKPTDIIQLQCFKEINNFDHVMHPDVIANIPRNIFPEEVFDQTDCIPNYRIIVLNSIFNKNRANKEWDMTPKDMRLAIIISRLGTILTERSEWLTDVKPICAPINDIEIVSFGEDHLEKEDLLDVINANLVYLCSKTNDVCIECYGIGIVRGIDKVQQKIYLLPSVPGNVLVNVNCLAVCNIPLPTSIIVNQGPKIKDITPYAVNTNDFFASKFINQIYHRPAHFLQANNRKDLLT